jgi:thiol:disulfide interchange protein DsbC
MTRIHTLTLALSLAMAVTGTACADESTIRAEMAKKFPKANIEGISKTPYGGLYEVRIGEEIFYTDGDFKFLIDGSIIDTRTMSNVTDEAKNKRLAVPFDQLPLDLAFKKVKGNGSRKIAVFSDPDCPFCRRLEQSFTKLDNVTIYIFLYPLEQLHPKAPEVSRAIWCSPDKVKAWDDYMLKGIAPKAASCDNPVDKIVEYGQSKRISGTPTLFFADGKRIPGAIPLEQIEDQLAKSGNGK